jgi:hypothetical protein
MIVVGVMTSTASAQRFGGGGLAPGSTVYGDGMRGEGVFLNGLGQYNLSTAMANSTVDPDRLAQ